MFIYFLFDFFPILQKPYSGYFLLGVFTVIFPVLEIIVLCGVIYTFYLVIKCLTERKKKNVEMGME